LLKSIKEAGAILRGEVKTKRVFKCDPGRSPGGTPESRQAIYRL